MKNQPYGRRRDQSTRFYMTLIGITLISAVSHAAENKPLVTLLEEYPLRQQICLEEIASASQSTMEERQIADFFLRRNPDQVNQFFQTYQSNGTTQLHLSVLLRVLLMAARSGEKQFLQETQSHLATVVESLIRQGGRMFANLQEMDLVAESQQILGFSNLYLWANYVEEQGIEYHWQDQQENTEHLQRYETEILEWIRERVYSGIEERSSPYYLFSLAALLNVRDITTQENLRTVSDGFIDILLADIAQESIQHAWGGARCRSFEAISALPGARLHYIMFDQSAPVENHTQWDWLTFHLGSTGYQPPPVLVRLGGRNQERGTFEIKNYFPRNRKELNRDTVEKYSYVTPGYILGSFQLRDEPVPWQSRPWDLLVYVDGKEHHLFTFLDDQLFSGGKPPYTQEYFLWNCTTFQYKNILYFKPYRSDRKREGSQPPHEIVDERFVRQPIRVWVPNLFDPIEEEGWWFCRTDSVFIAFRPLEGKAHWWRAGETTDSSEQSAMILSFDNLDTAFVMEIEEASHFSSLEEFKQQVINSLKVNEQSATLVSRRGDIFLFPGKQGGFLVNGQIIDSNQDSGYGLFASPYTRSQYGTGIFEAHWNPHRLILDFRDLQNPRRENHRDE